MYANGNMTTAPMLSQGEQKALQKTIKELRVRGVIFLFLFFMPVILGTIYILFNFVAGDTGTGIFVGLLMFGYIFGIGGLLKFDFFKDLKSAKNLECNRFTVHRDVILERKIRYDRTSLINDFDILRMLTGRKLQYTCYVTTEHSVLSTEVFGFEVEDAYNGRWANMKEGNTACILHIYGVNNELTGVLCIAAGDEI